MPREETLEEEWLEGVWEDVVAELKEFCRANGGKVEEREWFGEEIVMCTLPEQERIFVTGKLYPNGDREITIEPEEGAYVTFTIPEDVNVYLDTLKDSNSGVKFYRIRENYAEYDASPKGARRIEIQSNKRNRRAIFIRIL